MLALTFLISLLTSPLLLAEEEPTYDALSGYQVHLQFTPHNCFGESGETLEETIPLGKVDAEGRCQNDPTLECDALLRFVIYGPKYQLIRGKTEVPSPCIDFEGVDCKYLEMFPKANDDANQDLWHFRQIFVNEGKVEEEHIGNAPLHPMLERPLRFQLTIDGCSFFEIQYKVSQR